MSLQRFTSCGMEVLYPPYPPGGAGSIQTQRSSQPKPGPSPASPQGDKRQRQEPRSE